MSKIDAEHREAERLMRGRYVEGLAVDYSRWSFDDDLRKDEKRGLGGVQECDGLLRTPEFRGGRGYLNWCEDLDVVENTKQRPLSVWYRWPLRLNQAQRFALFVDTRQ
ncbi:MAG: hypothetical protein K6T83_23900 [Alicyclobacillus sp.]|nr:hypothetical protein [Alicyclobacillus sp.]